MSDDAPTLSPEGTDYRDAIVDYLRGQLIGPIDGPGEVLSDPPRVRYLLGLLFPQKSIRLATLVEEDDDSDLVTDGEEAENAPIVATDDWLPSSLGISFFTTASTVACEVWAARYEETPSGRSRRWNRQELASRANPHKVFLTKEASSSQLFDNRAELSSVWRKSADGYLVTVALTNSVILEVAESGELTLEQKKLQDANCLHQVGFQCTPVGARLLQYPSITDQFRDQEEEELRLTFHHASVYGVGHGCSVSWSVGELKDDQVWTEHLPVHDISPIIYDLDGFDDILELSNLVTYSDSKAVSSLDAFVDDYVGWHKRLLEEQVSERFSAAKVRILERILEAATRMRSGIRYLEAHSDSREAFRLANRAMLMQMFRNKQVIQDKSYARNAVKEADFDIGECRFKWRPFQLAFQLLALESASEPTHQDRDIVDLIWFPTGGGKTEAYLGLAAYVIFLRRLRLGDKGAGTAVITRYTLSLLTAQQFQRAATLVCAIELIRQQSTSLGNKPFRIGLWIGEKNVPNRFSKARELFEIMIEEDEPRNPFQLQQCPWCGTLIIPSKKSSDSDYGITSSENSFNFFCPTDSCAFHTQLPIDVIDEALYKNPPTLLLATVDKFAQLPWDDSAVSFFGGCAYAAPSLIIQDELHLLSGPLGTTVGLYETGIEALISLKGGNPKIVSSTATIRRSSEQITGLFGRHRSRVFPPSGLDSRDSYYARASTKAGRRYVGILPQSHSTQTAMINTASALLQSPIACGLVGAELDAMWTLVAYHNSLRELGRTVNLSRDDIPERISAWNPTNAREIPEDTVMELRSNLDGAALPKRLQQLNISKNEDGALSIVCCTNMFSVGVDVQRLGLMLVNGQPKSVSEYIQATSRVGRGVVPGLVLALYGATRPRDRSHYEQFRAFHSALYMHVEPSSVTPFSPQSRDRALHAVLVMLMRHWGGLPADGDAVFFDKDSTEVKTIRELIAARVRVIDSEEADATIKQLDYLIAEWDEIAKDYSGRGASFFYRSAGRSHSNLLAEYGKPKAGMWRTLKSMRNVDAECGLAVLGAK